MKTNCILRKFSIFIFVMFFWGCGTTADTGHETKSIADSEPTQVTKLIEKKEIDMNDKKTEDFIPRGKVLDGLERVGNTSPYYCTAEANCLIGYYIDDLGYSTSSDTNFVCKDPVYDITYYVNYGRDYLIYALRGEKSELAVDIPGYDLFCRDGKLYFITHDYNMSRYQGLENGSILCYDPIDGSLQKVTEQHADRMTVYPDGIYIDFYTEYKEYGEFCKEAKKTELYYYSFADEKLQVRTTSGRDRVGELLLQCERAELPEDSYGVQTLRSEGVEGSIAGRLEYRFVDKNEETVYRLSTLPYSQYFFRVSGDTLYSIEYTGDVIENGEFFAAYDLKTGERTELTRIHYVIGNNATLSFVILNNILYTGRWTRYSLADGTESYLAKRQKDDIFQQVS